MSNAQSSSGKTAKRGILLLEEYSALAAAIGSALKKFAPSHSTHVARSLKEAETLAAKIHPELFLIDVDPPWPKLTQLLGKLRNDHPEARVLVIGATIPKELIENRGSQRALQFLEKPFDVSELGAAVQALLGPWKESESEELRGTLRSFSAVDAALLQCASARTVVVEVKKSSGKAGELHFVDGQLFHVENGKRSGVEALEELLSWVQPELREKEKRGRTTKRTIPAPWTEAFLKALQKAKPHRPEPVAVPAARPVVPKAAAKTGKKIVIVDDTEMLLIFVEDVLMTAQPDLQITTAGNGLSAVKEIERALPDLVLLDYSLPDFNGDEVCRQLLANESTAHVPVLMMSGHVPEMTRAAASLENVVATIEKPFLSDALVTVVQQTLEAGPELRRKAAARRPAEAKPAPPVVSAPELPSVPPPPPIQTGPPPPPPRSQRTAIIAPPRAEPFIEAPTVVPQPPKPPQIKEAPPVEKPALTPAVQPTQIAPPPAPPARPKTPSPTPAKTPPPPPRPVPSRPPPPAPVKVAPIPSEHPVPHVISVAPPVQQIPRPGIGTETPTAPVQPAPLRREIITAPVLGEETNEVVLGLFLEVVSMQLTPALRMGAIRARLSSTTASLHSVSPALRAALPPNGFQLGAIDLDRTGRIAVIRVIPTVQPFTPLETGNAFQIGGVAVVPENSHERLQLTPTTGAPMRMHLLARLEVAGVELSSTFQISQLILKSRTTCEASGVQLDAMARLAELTLNPVS